MTAPANLTAAGFTAGNDGVLRAAGCQVEINPVGAHFYELRIIAGGNSVVSVVVPKIAVKVTRESTSLATDR